MKKNVLIVDDSALMRRVICDIIQSDDRYLVEDMAKDGQEAYELLTKKRYDLIVLDINMPRMTGLELLEVMKREGIRSTVLMASSLTRDGAKETFLALELGAVDFVTKPGNYIEARGLNFRDQLRKALDALYKATGSTDNRSLAKAARPVIQMPKRPTAGIASKATAKIIALACSTGGPRSLQSVIPYLPANLNAAVLIVQHMPSGFTETLADRLNDISEVTVKEAQDKEPVKKGYVYIAPGGKHLKCVKGNQGHMLRVTDEPPRDALKPNANIMYESLLDSLYEEVVCVVLTGMGSDGTKGIEQLKTKKKLYVIAQDAASSVVYGMPKAVAQAGLTNEIVALDAVAEAITRNVGVH